MNCTALSIRRPSSCRFTNCSRFSADNDRTPGTHCANESALIILALCTASADWTIEIAATGYADNALGRNARELIAFGPLNYAVAHRRNVTQVMMKTRLMAAQRSGRAKHLAPPVNHHRAVNHNGRDMVKHLAPTVNHQTL